MKNKFHLSTQNPRVSMASRTFSQMAGNTGWLFYPAVRFDNLATPYNRSYNMYLALPGSAPVRGAADDAIGPRVKPILDIGAIASFKLY